MFQLKQFEIVNPCVDHPVEWHSTEEIHVQNTFVSLSYILKELIKK